METSKRKSVSEKLKVFNPSSKEESFIEVTEWTNGEGWDISIDDRSFSLHMDELDAIIYLTKYIEYNRKEFEDDSSRINRQTQFG